MADLPTWVQTSQALVAPAIAGAVAVIGFLQWRTAHQKVLLDLFEKRITVYEAVNEAVRDAITKEGNLVPYNVGVSLHRARTEAGFLFGKEVAEEVQRIIELSRQHGIKRRELESRNLTEKQRASLGEEFVALNSKLNAWLQPWTEVCRPYMTMDQKRVRTPAEWFRDRNELRKSFDDQR